ncbi:DNA -binding domain-containing protein [Ferrovibrio sp.]|uniref:DNA -binding domain-containing protein n=1 Tax=Ferrovibrio sp. TaxID=1917215 RepID=UPI00311DFEB2
MTSNSSIPPILDEAPCSDQLTEYDRAHAQLYLRLLDAEAAGADPSEISQLLLDLDPAQEPERARRRLVSHLKRAHWMAQSGYRDLLSS